MSRSILRKINKEVATPVGGQKVLESLGCNNWEIVISARDEYGNEIDVAR